MQGTKSPIGRGSEKGSDGGGEGEAGGGLVREARVEVIPVILQPHVG